jgi:hypothetical protein
MFGVELICSDEACTLVVEAVGPDLAQLDFLVCDECGCTLQITAVWEVEEIRAAEPAYVLPLAA